MHRWAKNHTFVTGLKSDIEDLKTRIAARSHQKVAVSRMTTVLDPTGPKQHRRFDEGDKVGTLNGRKLLAVDNNQKSSSGLNHNALRLDGLGKYCLVKLSGIICQI